MLKRHLKTSYGMTPDEYRTKWGLPLDYPMVAPSYAATRSGLAKKSGLGRKPARGAAETTLETALVEADVMQLPARRASGSKR